ncbi:MAG TPA: hypothetical protein VN634_00325 [Candidatus Limnocylindrales bacterium]|nr:hypothetical protein [Candidatus Limnocylindrales bacterium]
MPADNLTHGRACTLNLLAAAKEAPMIRIVTRLACAPKNRRKIAENAGDLVRLFEKHGLRSEGVFENFAESEIIHLWSAEDMATYDAATARLRSDPEFLSFAAAAAEPIVSERKEYWRALALART